MLIGNIGQQDRFLYYLFYIKLRHAKTLLPTYNAYKAAFVPPLPISGLCPRNLFDLITGT